jgi:tRNA-uridine 2-sulfurtransferase
MRIIVAMSGGVDSSVAAALLVEAGHDVVGLSMQLYDQREGDVRFGSCCTLDDLHDARRVAAAIGVPHYILNFEQQFRERVIANFVHEYARGRTPLPCARCNSELKFATLLDRAEGFGAVAVATGHYARVEPDAVTDRFVLRRGLDVAKDQSYFLFSLTQDQLSRALFPLGTWGKEEVRRYAGERGLRVAAKRDSQELCFVPTGHYAGFIERQAPGACRPGLVLDGDGRVLGRHDGIHHFTVGQRKGLGITSGARLFVTEIDAVRGTVVVGPRSALERTTLTASSFNWISGTPPSGPLSVTAQIRYRHPAAPAIVRPIEIDRAAVEFETPQPAIAPGQAVVIYDGDVVVGGGWID